MRRTRKVHAGRLLLLNAAVDQPQAIVLLRDDDRQSERRCGLDQARSAARIGVPIVIGLASAKRECWVLAGFDPGNDRESEQLRHLRAELGFDPRKAAEQLTATHATDKRSAKRVLDKLTADNPQREADCWRKTNLERLAARGKNTGLADYLKEVGDRLVPLFAPRRNPS